jgi:hypothetical protein
MLGDAVMGEIAALESWPYGGVGLYPDPETPNELVSLRLYRFCNLAVRYRLVDDGLAFVVQSVEWVDID